MDHPANGRLVDSHAEGNGGHHDLQLIQPGKLDNDVRAVGRQWLVGENWKSRGGPRRLIYG